MERFSLASGQRLLRQLDTVDLLFYVRWLRELVQAERVWLIQPPRAAAVVIGQDPDSVR